MKKIKIKENKNMNKVILIGRLTKDPEIRYTNGNDGGSLAVARYTLAINRRLAKNAENRQADFIPCVTFGKNAEVAEKYFRKGIKIAVSGRIQTGSYTNKDGQKVYTTDVVVEEQEFAESRNGSTGNAAAEASEGAGAPDYSDIPDDIDLPF